ncbi:MAG: choice-of-anchor D domain-containing protein [Planctomycetes bacterium]|nr:choice-of-anchor D domain-containing protein [Planctomycetota bacterium]
MFKFGAAVCGALILALATAAQAQDYGDAPASYGLATASSTAPELLGTGWTSDATNPVTPAWTGDADDGIVGTVATWTPGLSTNTVTVKVVCGGYTEYLAMFIDMNDDGDFLDSGERIDHPNSPMTTDANFTFSNISLPFINYTRNGVNKIAVRFMLKYASAIAGPSDSFSYGEVEDYLLNVYPAGLGIVTASPLPNAAVGTAYQTTIVAMFGTTPYNWNTAISGLPAGLSASIVNNDLRIAGMPTATGTFVFNVSLTDSATPQANANRNYQITVVPPPAATPFLDTFATDKGWIPGSTWSRGVATAYSAASPTRSEPGTDATASTSDNMILGDTRGGDYAASMSAASYAVSPTVNCSTLANVRLRFQRWLGCSIGSTASIEVSTNGTSWTLIWSSTGGTSQTTITDTAWTLYQYDLTTYAAGMATVQVRFGIGPTATVHTGWCIDDFEILDPGPDLDVKEGGTGGTSITNNQAVGGLRDFGQVNMGVQSQPLTIGLINNGSTAITFQAFTKTGANPGDFYVNAGSMTNPLPVGQSTSFTITFFVSTSGTSGVKTATVNIPHNAGGVSGQNFAVNLRGDAQTPGTGGIEVFTGSTSGAPITHQQAAAGTARDFGSVLVGSSSAPLTIVISNPGPGTLTMTTPDMAGTWWNQYTVNTTGFISTLPQGQTTSFTVAFSPTSIGQKDAFVRIPNTKQGGPATFEVPVTGNGIAPNPAFEAREGSVTGTPIADQAPATGTARDFGQQGVSAGATTPLTIVVNNPGGQPLTVSVPTLTGANAGDFILNTTGYTTTVAAGANTSFTVAFDPTSMGVKNATITITHNDTAVPSPFSILVTGEGVTAVGILTVRESSGTGAILPNPAPATGILDFGNRAVGIGPGTPVTVYIENTGTGPMTLVAPAFQPSTSEWVLVSTGFAGSVPAGQSRTFTIAFQPSSLGAKTGSVVFQHNGGGTSSPFILNIKGNGIPNAPLVEVREGSTTGSKLSSGTPATINGGRDLGSIDTAAGPSAAKTFVIMNVGATTMNVGAPILNGPNASQFTLNTAGFGTTIAAGASAQFSVSFDPSAVGIKDASIEVTHDDTTVVSPFIINIMGTGTSATGVTITTTALPNGEVGKPYTSTALTAAQGVGPYTWSLYKSQLPKGLTLSAGGMLDGMPLGTGGVFLIKFRVTDSTGGTNDAAISLTIGGGNPLAKKAGAASGGGGCVAGVTSALAPVLFSLIGLVALRRRRKQ